MFNVCKINRRAVPPTLILCMKKWSSGYRPICRTACVMWVVGCCNECIKFKFNDMKIKLLCEKKNSERKKSVGFSVFSIMLLLCLKCFIF